MWHLGLPTLSFTMRRSDTGGKWRRKGWREGVSVSVGKFFCSSSWEERDVEVRTSLPWSGGKDHSTGVMSIDCTVMINPLSVGHLVLGLEGVWDNQLNGTCALASWGHQVRSQCKPPRTATVRWLNRNGASWILIELFFLSPRASHLENSLNQSLQEFCPPQISVQITGQKVPQTYSLSSLHESALFKDKHWTLFWRSLFGSCALLRKGIPHFVWFSIHSGL